MFRQVHSDAIDAGPVSFSFDGKTLVARPGTTIAATLLENGILSCRRTPVSGSPRGPYCMMGVCFECLVIVNGVGNRQGCLVPVTQGMVVETQAGPRRTNDTGMG